MDSYLWCPCSWFPSLEVSRLNEHLAISILTQHELNMRLLHGHVGLLLANMVQSDHMSHPKKV